MTTNVQIVFYSMYGHLWRMAEAVAEGVHDVEGAAATLLRVPELVPDEVLEKSGAKAAQRAFAHLPIAEVERLREADAIVFGTPTRFGNMAAQMRNFLDQTGSLWAQGALVGKVGSVFAGTATQHGGQETTITSFHTTLLHRGMVIVGVPFTEPRLSAIDAVNGGTPYGATTISGGRGQRMPSEDELAVARVQGRHVAEVAGALKRGRA